jgi:hypothetical protein
MTDIPRFKNPHVNTINSVPNTCVVIDINAKRVVDDVLSDDHQSAKRTLKLVSSQNVFEQDQLVQRGIANSSDEEANRPNAFRTMFNKLKIIY